MAGPANSRLIPVRESSFLRMTVFNEEEAAMRRNGAPCLPSLRLFRFMAVLSLFLLAFLALSFIPSHHLPQTEAGERPSLQEGAGTREGLAPPTRQKRDHLIHWMGWGKEAFDLAGKEDKLILLDLTAVWCHWCHVMDETTYSDLEIIEMLNRDFVPVRVEADRFPDVGQRYLANGWPTTAVLLPSGKVMVSENYVSPGEMKLLLIRVKKLYRDHRQELLHRAGEMREKILGSQEGENSKTAFSEAVKETLKTLEDSFDEANGGFEKGPKFPNPDAISLLFSTYHETKEKKYLAMALKTLDGQSRLMDPVWGGMFRYATDERWGHPHYEKILSLSAGALRNYLDAYLTTGEKKYRETAEGILSHARRFLTDSKNGGFYGSQDADVGSHLPGARFMRGEEYYAMSERERLKTGTPMVDQTKYADSNGKAALAWLQAWEVLGDDSLRATALKSLRLFLRSRSPKGAFPHYLGDRRRTAFLMDQVYLGQGLLEAFQISGDKNYLLEAESTASFIQKNLLDQKGYGAFDATPSSPAIGQLILRRKPIEENAALAQLFLDLWAHTEKPRYRILARRILSYLRSHATFRNQYASGIALAMKNFMREPTRVVVISTDNAQEMVKASGRAYIPWRIVSILNPGGASRFERRALPQGRAFLPRGVSTAYVCVGTFCSAPLTSPQEVEDFLKKSSP